MAPTELTEEDSSPVPESSSPSPVDGSDTDFGGLPESPASPAALWASTSKVAYSCEHSETAAGSAWVDSDTTIRND
ncbi:hypothetical protein [Salininema proteolyticum]|uniref:Uncharacterized protein n=1 Tax=Salininema proteolyticum TaxID=1607685 RepID=A0ABV8TS93_9ACTN